jgi:tryptophan-rich sensory protein
MDNIDTRPPAKGANPWLVFAAFLMAVYMVGALGSLAAGVDVRGWYAELAKPFFAPPAWLFGPVWFVLYGLIALAGWLIWQSPAAEAWKRPALLLFSVQLVLNGLWSPAFFGLRSPELALMVAFLLLAAILATIRAFWGIDRRAALMLAPYAAWVGFASALTGSIAALN